ncbi:hypothetical protein SprV_0602085700 [Sparganum proliferum]
MIKRDDGVELYKDDEKAEHLSRFFQSVSTRDVAVPDDHHNVDDVPTIDSVVLTKAIVQQELLKLKEAKSPGPDEIPTKLLKELATELAEPLCLLFQASLDEGRLPPEWKTAWISPIHKSGSRASANNYRPVSLTSICCKVMERFIKRELMRFLEQHRLLSNAQHRFRRGRSCLTNLLYCLEQWTRAIDEGNVVHVAYIDFKKAFDSVPHQRLLYKLSRIGVRGKLLKWIENFLIGRSQTVRLGGQQSAEVTVTSGVPQGSVLGPILFLTYIDACIHGLDCDIAMFADDIKLWTVIRNEDDEAKLQANLDRLEQWSGYRLLPFNVSKCNILRIVVSSPALNDCVCGVNGGFNVDHLAKVECWREYFKHHSNFDAQPAKPLLSPVVKFFSSPTYAVSCDPPSEEEEVVDAIQRIRNKRTPGEGGIPPEIYKSCVHTLAPWLHELIEQEWTNEVAPDEWGSGIPIPIIQKGDETTCENFRGISLIDFVVKMFAVIIPRRFMSVRDYRSRLACPLFIHVGV